MSKTKTITEQIHDLEQENLRLKNYEKLFEKALKNEFNMSKKSIIKSLNFQEKIMQFFELKTTHDLENFQKFLFTEIIFNQYKKYPLDTINLSRDNDSNYQ